jgi:hypothetical protein
LRRFRKLNIIYQTKSIKCIETWFNIVTEFVLKKILNMKKRMQPYLYYEWRYLHIHNRENILIMCYREEEYCEKSM